MTKAKAVRKSQREPDKVHKLDDTNPKLKYLGGSNFDAWNGVLANQALNSAWYGNNPDTERTHKQQTAGLSFLAGFEPKGRIGRNVSGAVARLS